MNNEKLLEEIDYIFRTIANWVISKIQNLMTPIFEHPLIKGLEDAKEIIFAAIGIIIAIGILFGKKLWNWIEDLF